MATDIDFTNYLSDMKKKSNPKPWDQISDWWKDSKSGWKSSGAQDPYSFTPDTSSPEAFAKWWAANSGKMSAAWRAKYQPYVDQLNAELAKWPSYAPVKWEGSDYQNRYNTQQGGMDALLARIGAGPTASDTQGAMDQTAQMYGYSPASWTALQEMYKKGGISTDPTMVTEAARNIAANLANDPFGQEQQKAMRVAQQAAVQGVGKQLESIFGDRGSVGGFASAYEMTLQLQSSFLQQGAQNAQNDLDRATTAVNAENGYYQDLISKGAIQAQDYLKFRWDTLQQGYQDYILAMDQTMKEWTTTEQVSQEQYNTEASRIQGIMDGITKALAAEMGVDEAVFARLKDQYDLANNAVKDLDASTQAGKEADEATVSAVIQGITGVVSLFLGNLFSSAFNMVTGTKGGK
jgi:hypothetical protein